MKNYYPAMLMEPIETEVYTLSVTGSGEEDDLTPTPGKKIRLLRVLVNVYIGSGTTATAAASLSFGDDGDSDKTKILYVADSIPATVCSMVSDHSLNMNVLGGTSEIIRLTNRVFTGNAAAMNCTLYYREE